MNDVKGYIERLDKSMTRKEKLFFFNKVKLASYDFIVDFGCANGRLLYEVDKQLGRKNKRLRLIGVEKNGDIAIAYQFVHCFRWHKTLEDLPLIAMAKGKVLLILSSVLHEVDCSTKWDIINFAQQYADTVVIRDMYFQISGWKYNREKKKTANFINNNLNLLTVNESRIWKDIYRPTITGGVNVKKLYEFFLKYTYKENWATERNEDYFCSTVRQVASELVKGRYDFKLKYCKHYILPYKKKSVKQNFNYKMVANTHIKVILERKKKK